MKTLVVTRLGLRHLALAVCLAVALGVETSASAGTAAFPTPASPGGSGGTGSTCPDSSVIAQNAQQIATLAANVANTIIPQPQDIAQASCLSTSLGIAAVLTYPSVTAILNALEGLVCSALNSAVQWPINNLNNAISQGLQGLGVGSVVSASVGNGASPAGVSTSGSALGGGTIGASTGSISSGSAGVVNSAVGQVNSGVNGANTALTGALSGATSGVPSLSTTP